MNEAKLTNLASQTAILARELPQYRATLNVLTGAVFALLRAEELKYKHRDGQLTEQYSVGAIRADGQANWVLGTR